MKILLIGVGSVGEAIAKTAKDQPWLEKMILADVDIDRVKIVAEHIDKTDKFIVEKIDASNKSEIIDLARKYSVHLIMNAVTNFLNDTIFDAAFEAGCGYIDMAMSGVGEMMGSFQFGQHDRWQKKGLLAILGMGADPGISNIFAKYASMNLFDEIDEIGIRDGATLEIQGYEFAPSFSILDTIEECTDAPLVWEKDRGWYTTEPFSEAEVFNFPENIGPIKCVNVEHEEVVMIPRYIQCKRVTFKYGLGDKFINTIRVIKMLGMDRGDLVNVNGIFVSPRDVLAACLPDPVSLGDKMQGKTCVGTWVKGWKDGNLRQVYIYQSTDNRESMRKYGCQAVGWQTGVAPVIAMHCLATGKWQGKGVLCPEAFDPQAYMDLMAGYDYPYHIKEFL
jgi:saccharopine dehydrogenase (NAD+, L-lysine-forming)